MATVTLSRGDFWELRARCAEYTAIIERAKQAAQQAAAAKDALIIRMAKRYGFDPARDFSLEDADLTLRQGLIDESGGPRGDDPTNHS